MNIPFIDLASQFRQLEPAIRARIDRVLAHGQYIMGPEVAELESRLADYTGAGHCITVASGTDALVIALMALDIGPGDEVITTPFTFAASAEAVKLVGATPVFVDIDAETCNIDPALVEAAVTERTRAIMPVSLYGLPADMDPINAIAARHGLPVIEDAAQSFGADYRGRRSCHLSTIGCTSFYPSKPLGCYGDGGALFTDDDGLAGTFRQIRVHGQDAAGAYTRIGLTGRMDTLQCAIVLAKLDTFDDELARRRAVAARYRELFAANPRLRPLPPPADGLSSAYAQFTVLTDERDVLEREFAAAGVPTAVHYRKPLHHQAAYAAKVDLPVAERLAGQVLCLPMSPYLTDAELERIAAVVA